MAVSEVGICNLALARIGTKTTIASLDENSAEARQCKLLYEPTRDAVLRAHPWAFARQRRALSILTGETDGQWAYVYSYPSDCLLLRYLEPDIPKAKPPKHALGLSADGKKRTVLTDKEGAVAIYTARVSNTALFDPEFVVALSYALGVELAPPLGIDARRQQAAAQGYGRALAAAQATNAGEETWHDPVDPDWIAARA